MPPIDLSKEVNSLKGLSAQAIAIGKELKALADANKEATSAHHAALEALVKAASLGSATVKSATDRVRERISSLGEQVSECKLILGAGPSAETRARYEGKLNTSLAELARLNLELGTNYDSLLTPEEYLKIEKSLEGAAADIKAKKTAKALADVSLRVGDMALVLADKLAKAAIG